MAKQSGFNLIVHQRDAKGKIVNVDPYRLTIKDGQQLYERPPGSQKFFYANGKPVVEAEAKAVPSPKK